MALHVKLKFKYKVEIENAYVKSIVMMLNKEVRN